ncbi:L-lactate dehydrogenase/FMN-dependent alpha-hydroxy acid dehydrogenase [Azotobacter vinelandii CA]|uniref:L-lactate dehydrogenase/FMN-dependent alpha-hydroxy acid dehydrogenase n=2 Tax=Azotobacter vinelandii TaxID=354 RepID=C1DQ10_AZOVD|nr:alpha-hydroxy acid oxidase [Azotobacter vinelandii]ACO77462.1 L-lactate dehydrogenase/FMN-dependent alpha-hydroxy acid dehydrogenase [Azotobacter vinelandii DJ]AGK13672.1 L-lactate dehydrogenase/FMN-dependent alpha-hydroxy acid dehydrogenase [Azotobacter vinelandii CA]AGK18211.1 L-lactate dehydrogenase/FMN-dependent alpha-hydroxy acid dehydrogenase [Azotobacter vinelandii CA6]SFX49581.1 4-hydroxymandelate oxidase [Azotobacter vinelandii]GLK60978.1 alpha-hydroxy-acid oxidizing enzyme [Azotob
MHDPLPKLQQIPASIAALADYEPFARERMSEQAWAYMAGGAADELTLRDNCAAFQRLRLRSRALPDLTDGHTRLELFGQRFEQPILLAPVAYQKLVHPDGELATVLAASAARAGMVVSTQASVALEDIARQAQTPLWFQLYVQPDRAFTRELVQRAEAAGYQALVVTVDAPVSGLRNREQRAGFALPEGVEAVNLRGMRALPPTIARIGDSPLFGGPLLAAAPTWRELAWLRSLTRLPLLVKGVMHPEDARRALAEGIDGIIVSNHGGRTLDTQPATIEVLEEIAGVVEGRLPLLLDGGIRRGTDVLKALALGASAVLVGRSYVFALAAAGAPGVCHALQLLRAELEVAMALTGCRTLADIGPELLWRPGR